MYKPIKKYLPKIVTNVIYKLLHFNRTFLLKGDKYLCPICNFNASKFIPYGEKHDAIKKYNIIGMGYRNNAICPNCFSKDRERLVYLFLQKLLKQKIINFHSKIIHFSPESSLENNLFRKNFTNYTTADIIFEKCDVNIDLQNFKYEDKNFDFVICNHVLEHIENDNVAIKNIYTILKKGGFAILQVPLSIDIKEDFKKKEISTEKEQLNLYGQRDHVRIYSKKNYVEKIKKAGFKIHIDKMKKEKNNIPSFGLNFNEFIILVEKN
jgi:SAM-dependent methyltransferase